MPVAVAPNETRTTRRQSWPGSCTVVYTPAMLRATAATPHTSVLSALALGVSVGSLAGLWDGVAAVAADFAGNGPALVAQSWALGTAWVTLLTLACWAWSLLARGPRQRHPLLDVLWLAVPFGAFALWIPTSWVVGHWSKLPLVGRTLAVTTYAVLLALTFAAVWLVRGLQRRYREAGFSTRLRRSLLFATGALAVASYLADRFVLVGLYDDFHSGLCALFLISLTGSLAVLATSSPNSAIVRTCTRLRSFALGPLALAFALIASFEAWPPDVYGPAKSILHAKFVSSARRQTDFDHDGSSGSFGGSDCAPFNARIGPHQFDFPSNGKDEDCSGQDSEWAVAPPLPDYPIPEAQGFNVVLLTVDALRADHLGSYGYERKTSPNLDALAARSVRFEKAFSPASKTFGSLPALMSGLYPSNVPRLKAKKQTDRARTQRKLFGIDRDAPFISELFQAKGYQTATFLSAPALLLLGLDRGFDDAQSGRLQIETSISTFAEHDKPFFHWIHLNAPHAPYEAHPEFPFGGRDIDRYDSEIAHDDARIGTLLEALEREGIADKTIVIVSADHGEEFRDHGGQFHTFRLYRELIHVPLIVHIPGVAPNVISDPVEVIGAVPMLCELLRLSDGDDPIAACDRFDSRSLLAPMAGRGAADQNDDWGAFSELVKKDGTHMVQSLYTRQWHIIRDYASDRVELYDVQKDPSERKNLARKHPTETKALLERLTQRPLVRAGKVFREYERTRDLQVVAEGLPQIQNPRVLPHAYFLLAQEPKRFSTELAKLDRRPSLPPSVRARLTKDAKASAKKRSKR